MAQRIKQWDAVLVAMGIDTHAPDGTLWVCGVCERKTTRTRSHLRTSCVTHAVLCYKKKRRYGYVAVDALSDIATEVLNKVSELVAYDRLRVEMEKEAAYHDA